MNKNGIFLLMLIHIPANFSITVNSEHNVFELKPIEQLNIYEGMEVIEPTLDYPLRRYNLILKYFDRRL